MRRKRKLKRRGSFKLWRKRSKRSISIANVWYVRGKGCSCNSAGLTQGAEVTTSWCNELWDIDTGIEQQGKTVNGKVYKLEQTIEKNDGQVYKQDPRTLLENKEV